MVRDVTYEGVEHFARLEAPSDILNIGKAIGEQTWERTTRGDEPMSMPRHTRIKYIYVQERWSVVQRR